MAIQNLTLYDLIVDLTPGIAAIFVFIPLFPSESLVAQALFGGPFQFGLSLLVLGYVLGRFLHAISGSKPIEIARETVDKWYIEAYKRLFSKKIGDVVEKSRFIHSGGHFDRGANDISVGERIKNDDTRSQKICKHASSVYLTDCDEGESGEIERFKHFGESLLYGERGLYRKYEMLSTFFRNLGFLFSVSFFIYTIYAIVHVYPVDHLQYRSIWAKYTSTGYPYWTASIGFLLLSFISHTQRLQFIHRKRRAFIDDLYTKLLTDGPNELLNGLSDTETSVDDSTKNQN